MGKVFIPIQALNIKERVLFLCVNITCGYFKHILLITFFKNRYSFSRYLEKKVSGVNPLSGY